VLAGGMGQPYVTTDYPAVQRALEREAEALLVAKHGVDGVYTADAAVARGEAVGTYIAMDALSSRAGV
jgi:uridylate kinase